MKIAAVAWALGIVYLSHANGEVTAHQSRGLASFTKLPERFLRISAHFVCFFVLGLLSGHAWGKTAQLCGVLSALAFLDEWTKKLVSVRHFCWYEALINVISVVAGVLI